MSDFADLKLDSDLVEHLIGLGYLLPTALQVEAVPVIARGTTAVGIASAGSGKTLAYGLGLAGCLDPAGPGPQALVLRPTDDGAARTADTLHRLLGGRGLSVGVLRPDAAATTRVVTASPSSALAALERSAVKLDGLKTLVVDGVSAMTTLGAGEALETLTAQIPREAQRVILTSELTQEVEDLIERHARRARRLTYLPTDVEPLADASLEFVAAPAHEWLPVLVRLLGGGAKGGGREIRRIHCRREDESAALADRLTVRGIGIAASSDEPGVRIEWGSTAAVEPAALSISWGTPPDLPTFRARIEGSARTIVFAEPRELAHLGRLAKLLAVRLSALSSAVPPEALRSAQTTRDLLREAASSRDLEPYMLLLEPLLVEFTPTQIAAAAASLLRERVPDDPAQPLPAWTRLYFAIGRRDGVRPADLVGAITGEASISGEDIGRIEIRDTHTSVEVAATLAEKVIKALATATIRGRPASVRVFRE
jgi:ATP-dependent RNA helicase DeaD